MSKNIFCDNCGSETVDTVYRAHTVKKDATAPGQYTISDPCPKKPETIVKCRGCGLMFVPIDQEGSVFAKDYEDYVDASYIGEEKGRRRASGILLDRIAEFTPSGQMLEIGCANGFFLDEARKRGWTVTGIEPSRWAGEYAKEKLGIKILSSTLEECDFKDAFFDVVVMLDVIEHLHSPRSALQIINRILKPEGLLVITTPDVDSFLSRLLQAKWWGINRHHLYYFSRNTLEDIFERTGFRTLCYKSHARIFTLKYWVERISSYMPFIVLPARFLFRIFRFGKQNLKVSLYDQIEVYAKKT